MSNFFRCISQHYDEPAVVETRRTAREVALQDARLLRGITGRSTWVEDDHGNVLGGRRPRILEVEEEQDAPLDER